MKTRKKEHTKLRGFLAERRVSLNVICNLLCVTRMTLYNKLEGRSSFKQSEVQLIANAFDLTDKQVKELF